MDIPIKISCMGIVISKTNHVLILKSDEEWVFPKGHVELNEKLTDTACREVYEESGINISSKECIGMIDEFNYYFEGEEALKVIKVYLFVVTKKQYIEFNRDEGFTDGKWVTIKEAFECLTHNDSKKSLAKALEALK